MVVSEQKCLEVPSYENYGSPTYPVRLTDCYYSNDSGQFAFTFIKKGDNYYWVSLRFNLFHHPSHSYTVI
jgi:hypothetical protein